MGIRMAISPVIVVPQEELLVNSQPGPVNLREKTHKAFALEL